VEAKPWTFTILNAVVSVEAGKQIKLKTYKPFVESATYNTEIRNNIRTF
jgi:hypothetical protein